MATWLQLTLSGAIVGAFYALFALSLVLAYRTTRTLNFGIAGIGALGAYLVYELTGGREGGGIPWIAALLIAIAAGAILGVGVERAAIWPLRHSPQGTTFMSTAFLTLVLLATVTVIWSGGGTRIVSDLPARRIDVGALLRIGETVQVPMYGLILLSAAAVITAGLESFTRWSRWGTASRAAIDDPPVARLMGISPSATAVGAAAIGGMIAVFAGAYYGSTVALYPDVFAILLVKALAVALFAKLLSMPRALFGGIALGILEAYGGMVGVTGFQETVPFILLLALLVLFSGKFREEAGARTV